MAVEHRRSHEFVLGALLRLLPSIFHPPSFPFRLFPQKSSLGVCWSSVSSPSAANAFVHFLGSQNASHAHVFSRVCAMQMTVKRVLEVGDTAKDISDSIRFLLLCQSLIPARYFRPRWLRLCIGVTLYSSCCLNLVQR